MNNNALARELRAIARRGGGFGTETEAALNQLADLLDLHGDKSLAQLAVKLKPRTPRAPTSATFDTPAEGIVKEYLDRLKASRSAKEGLAIIDELKRRGGPGASVVVEIAGRYLGARMKLTKSGALTAIQERLERKDWDRGVLQSIADRAKM